MEVALVDGCVRCFDDLEPIPVVDGGPKKAEATGDDDGRSSNSNAASLASSSISDDDGTSGSPLLLSCKIFMGNILLLSSLHGQQGQKKMLPLL